jgi:hypothetical protein
MAGDRLEDEHNQEQREEEDRQPVVAHEPHASMVREADDREGQEPCRDQHDVDGEHGAHSFASKLPAAAEL